MWLGEYLGEFFGGERFTEEKTLHFGALERLEEPCLIFGFDTFGDDVQPEALRHGDYCRGDCRVVGIDGDVAHEGLVDLEGVDGEFLDVGEG